MNAALTVLLAPILASTVVFTWHGLRGTDPGRAATHLLALVEIIAFWRRGAGR
jgi:hypothetical protein